MFACIRCVQQGQAFEVFIVAQSAQRSVRCQCFFAQAFHQTGSHFAGEKSGANRVHAYAVFAPLACECAGEIDDRCFGGVVGQGFHAAGVTAKTGDGSDIDDAAGVARNHAVLAYVLAEDEIAAHIQVHDLVPGFQRMVFSGRTPCGTGVVHQNIDMTEGFERFSGQTVYVFFVGAISGNPLHINACGFQFSSGGFEVGRFARTQHDARARLAQRLRELKSESA